MVERVAGSSAAAKPPGAVQKEHAGLTAGEISKAGTEAVGEMTAKFRQAADEQRQRAADGLGGFAQALHKAANDLQTENTTMGRYTHMAAERLDEAARFLRQSDWNQMIEGAEDFARRQPWWFVGGAVAGGFIAARLVKGAATSRSGTGYLGRTTHSGTMGGVS